jgi:hypothetical protein
MPDEVLSGISTFTGFAAALGMVKHLYYPKGPALPEMLAL